MIFHLVSKADWDAQPADQPYRATSLETEGFIHCTKGDDLMLQVANNFYKAQSGEFYVLDIDESKLTSEVKWEAPADPSPSPSPSEGEGGVRGETQSALPPEAKAEFGDHGDAAPLLPSTPAPTPTLFPHIYGPINREAIVGMRKFTRADDGTFTGYAQIADADNPLNLKSASQLADELLSATDEFSESLKRFKDRVEGRMAEIDEKIKKL